MRKILTTIKSAFWLVFTTPIFVLAQDLGYARTLGTETRRLIDALLPVAVGLALLFFFWGLVMLIFRADDETAREKGKRIMIWGVIGLFVMLSIWGILAIMTGITAVGNQDGFEAPILRGL